MSIALGCTKGRRGGFALAVALGTIVIVGALIAGVFFASTQDFRIAGNSVLQTRALTAAEFGLNNVVSPTQWDNRWNSLAVGERAVRAYNPGDGSVDTVRVTRLTSQGFHLVSEGRAGTIRGAQANRRIGALLTLQVPDIRLLAALTVRGPTRVGGSSFINGNDTSMAGWDCPALSPGLPGLALPAISDLTTSGCSGLSCISGNPRVQESAAAGDTSTYFRYGSLDWQGLSGQASKRLLPSVTVNGLGPSVSPDGSCNTADARNWGDPIRGSGSTACDNYYPIIYAVGDVRLTGGYGQGILLVEGDLDVSGGFEFFGPVIVRGSLRTTGTGGHFVGGVMAANVELEQNTVLGDAVVQYSRCAVAKATAGSALPIFAKGRSWVELFQ